jgi:hypothetical protein
MRKDEILAEVRRLPDEDRMDLLEGIIELIAPPLSADEEHGLAEAIDEADREELVDGPEVLAKERRRLRDAK